MGLEPWVYTLLLRKVDTVYEFIPYPEPNGHSPHFYTTSLFNRNLSKRLNLILCQINPGQSFIPCHVRNGPNPRVYTKFFKKKSVGLLISSPRLCIQSGLFPSGFWIKCYVFHTFLLRATCSAFFDFLDSITL